MAGQPIVPKDSTPPLGPYSPGINASGTVYVSGTLALDADGAVVGVGDIKAQTRRVLESIRSVLEAAGGGLEDVVFNAIFLSDLADYKGLNEAYREFFPENPPARYCIRADLPKAGCLVEIASTAQLERGASR